MARESQPINVFEVEPHWAELTVPTLFSRQAALTPDIFALVFQEHYLTYQQLEEQANRLAHVLQWQGVGRETIVVLAFARGVEAMETLVASLSVWKAGGAFLILVPF